jgi:hypothetical protein
VRAISESLSPVVIEEKKTRRILVIDDVSDLVDMYRIMFEMK